MNLFDLYAKITLDTGDYDANVKKAAESSKTVEAAMKALQNPVDKIQQAFHSVRHPVETVQKAFESLKSKTEAVRHPIEALRSKFDEASSSLEKQRKTLSTLAGNYEKAKSNVKSLQKAYQDSVKATGEASSGSQELAQKISEARASADLAKSSMEKYASSVSKSGSVSSKLANAVTSVASKMKSGFSAAGKAVSGAFSAISGVAKGVTAGIGAIGAAAGAGIAALNNLAESTQEYRAAQGKLNTAFEAAGMSTETAQQAYSDFYGILGDTDTATEASQLLAKLAQSEEDVATWTNIAAGVSGTFGDSLPIEGLIEASNETAKVGQVTGALADALNWAGISEEEFNKQLEACGSESERNQLIMETLSGTYDEAAEAFYRNNEEIVKARDNQDRLNQVMANVGGAFESAKNIVLSSFMPTIEAAGNTVTGFITRLTSAFSEGGMTGLISEGGNIVVEIINGIVSKLPDVINSAKEIITSIISGIQQNMGEITSGAAEVITEFLTAAMDMFPEIIKLGLDLIINLVQGIADNIDQIVDSAVNMVHTLVEYLTNPEAINNFVSAALDIMLGLAEGLVEAIPDLITAVPEIIWNLVNAFFSKENWEKIKDIGSRLIEGIWEGITGLGSWLSNKVSGFFDGFVGGVKKFFGINSPSKLFRDEIGKNIGLGIAEGLEDSEDEAVKAANDLAESVYDKSVEWLDRQTKYQNYSLQEQLEVWEAIQDQFIKESHQYAEAEEEIFDLRQQIQEEFYDRAKELTTQITDLEQEYQDTLKDRAQEIFNSYGLFDAIPERQKASGRELIRNLEDQIAAMEEFYRGLDELSARGVGDDLVDEIREMGPDAIDELSALLSLSDEKLDEYAALYREKQALANQVAVEELSELRKSTTAQIQAQLTELQNLYNQNAPNVGLAFSNGLASGIRNGMSSVINSAVSVAQAAVEAVEEELGIHSPSRVFAGIGKNMALGLVQGWENQIGRIQKEISGSMSVSVMRNESSSRTHGRDSSAGGQTVVNQYIQAVPMTPAELARQSRDAFDRLRWA